MGIPDLWRLLRTSRLIKNGDDLSKLKGQRIAIDVSVLLHSFFGREENYILYGDTDVGMTSMNQFNNQLLKLSIIPIYVFDGQKMESDLKAATNRARQESRQEARAIFQSGYQAYCEGFSTDDGVDQQVESTSRGSTSLPSNKDSGIADRNEEYRRLVKAGFAAYETSSNLICDVIATLDLKEYSETTKSPSFLIAVGEADGLLADLAQKSFVFAIATIDSDLLCCGAKIINMRSQSGGVLFPFDWHRAEMTLDPDEFKQHIKTDCNRRTRSGAPAAPDDARLLFKILERPTRNRHLAELAILSGCDYASMQGFGMTTALRALAKFYDSENWSAQCRLTGESLMLILKETFSKESINHNQRRIKFIDEKIIRTVDETDTASFIKSINKIIIQIVNTLARAGGVLKSAPLRVHALNVVQKKGMVGIAKDWQPLRTSVAMAGADKGTLVPLIEKKRGGFSMPNQNPQVLLPHLWTGEWLSYTIDKLDVDNRPKMKYRGILRGMYLAQNGHVAAMHISNSSSTFYLQGLVDPTMKKDNGHCCFIEGVLKMCPPTQELDDRNTMVSEITRSGCDCVAGKGTCVHQCALVQRYMLYTSQLDLQQRVTEEEEEEDIEEDGKNKNHDGDQEHDKDTNATKKKSATPSKKRVR